DGLATLVDEVGDRRRIDVGAGAHVDHAADADRQHRRDRQPPAAPVHHVAVPDAACAGHRGDPRFRFVVEAAVASGPGGGASTVHSPAGASTSGSIGGSSGASTTSGSSMLID